MRCTIKKYFYRISRSYNRNVVPSALANGEIEINHISPDTAIPNAKLNSCSCGGCVSFYNPPKIITNTCCTNSRAYARKALPVWICSRITRNVNPRFDSYVASSKLECRIVWSRQVVPRPIKVVRPVVSIRAERPLRRVPVPRDGEVVRAPINERVVLPAVRPVAVQEQRCIFKIRIFLSS